MVSVSAPAPAPRPVARAPAEARVATAVPAATPAPSDPLAGARQAAETLDAMLPLSRAARREADRATPDQRREVAREFFTDLLDADEDGKVSRNEFVTVAKELFGREAAETLFARMDRDRDGNLGGEEMKHDLARGEGVLAEIFRKLFDTDGDGTVGNGEFRLGTLGRVNNTRASRFFNLMDRTGDGRASPREMRWLFGPMREDGGKTSPFLLDRVKLDRLA